MCRNIGGMLMVTVALVAGLAVGCDKQQDKKASEGKEATKEAPAESNEQPKEGDPAAEEGAAKVPGGTGTETAGLTPNPKAVQLGQVELTAVPCPIAGAVVDKGTIFTDVAAASDGSIFVVQKSEGLSTVLRRLKSAGGTGCGFTVDDSFGSGGSIASDDEATGVAVDGKDRVYFGRGVYDVTGQQRFFEDYVALMQRPFVAPSGDFVLALTPSNYEVQAWKFEPEYKMVPAFSTVEAFDFAADAAAYHGSILVAGTGKSKEDDLNAPVPSLVVLYNYGGEEKSRFVHESWNNVWISSVFQCQGMSICVVVNDTDQLHVFDDRGQHAGQADLKTLLGLEAPSDVHVTVGADKSYAALTHARSDGRSEGLIFAITGL